MKIVYLFLSIGLPVHGITADAITKIFQSAKPPFTYNLDVKIFASKLKNASLMICCHGYGANNQIGKYVHSSGVVKDHIISFNFPDYELRNYDPKKSSFGTINELLPLLYILKKCIVEGRQEKINLYGFSAGGAALINMLAALNHTTYDHALNEFNISPADKEKILTAIQNGTIILDCPLKSIEELMEKCGSTPEFEILAKRYAHNHMRPIDAVKYLEGLALNIVLYFENPDEIIGNRDDQLFIDRLKKSQSGKTEVIIGSFGGHNTYHKSLWGQYKTLTGNNI